MNVIALDHWDLAGAAALVLALGLSSLWLQLGLARQLLVAGVRTVVQLLLVGVVLKTVFAAEHPLWTALIGTVMLLVAAREVTSRQGRDLARGKLFASALPSLLLSCAAVLVLTLVVFIDTDPWYEPRYAIPIFGMLLGNAMTGVALGLNTLMKNVATQRQAVEQRLMLGATRVEALADIRREAMRGAMIPTVNAMATAGIVSLPGMMTGQILAGTPPVEAVKYQILVMFIITASTGFAIQMALAATARMLFDERHRLRLDRVRKRANQT